VLENICNENSLVACGLGDNEFLICHNINKEEEIKRLIIKGWKK
jgi:hypothetical protein